MIAQIDFTPAQLALIKSTVSVYVEACPGAGKTRAIVERFIRRSNGDPRRGVALISFTNAVVDEARSRCAGQLDLLRSPNFVGTLDSFINHFIVGPLLTRDGGRAYTFRSSWQQVSRSNVTVSGVRASAQLDWFVFTLGGSARLDLKRIPADRSGMIQTLEPWQIAKLEREAAAQWKRNVGRGIIDAATARLYLIKFLAEASDRGLLADLLGARFYEVIVDEVQDCSDEDVALLRLLNDAGVRLIMVGDPQQAIYGFRGGSSKELAALLTAVAVGTRLDGNFRSSLAICGAVDSLRSSSLTDCAVGQYRDITDPVQLARYTKPEEVRGHITATASRHSIALDDFIVLAHASAKARACAGVGGATRGTSTSRFVTLADIVRTIQDESVLPRVRAESLTGLESLLHQLSTPELAALDTDVFLARIGLSARAYREHCLRFALSLPPPYEAKPSVFRAALAGCTSAQLAMGWTMNGIKAPNGDKWASKPSSGGESANYSTIHGYKGLQSPAVVLVIPERITNVPADDDGLSQWTGGKPGEARNVLYVGASRAERLLLLMAHDSVFNEVKANLNRDSVNYNILEPASVAF